MKIIINVNSINEIEPKLKKISSLNKNYIALTAGMEVEFIVGSTYNDGKTIEKSKVTQTRDSIYMTFGECFDQFKKLYDNYSSTEKPVEFSELVFVEKDLYNILHSANNDVVSCTLFQDRDDKFVKITMKNGAKYTVDVSCDSPMAMAKDVISLMMYK